MARAKELAYGLLTCTGKVTITGMLIAVGKQFIDWTAAYQLFWGSRMKICGVDDNLLQKITCYVSLEK